ncbi:hypothetical protein B0H19DRAFT_1236386 [Mycena capillaripes]|nr:hypothetical protein B0H19DRAFT_1236386 [Mycena capillaripes]
MPGCPQRRRPFFAKNAKSPRHKRYTRSSSLPTRRLDVSPPLKPCSIIRILTQRKMDTLPVSEYYQWSLGRPPSGSFSAQCHPHDNMCRDARPAYQRAHREHLLSACADPRSVYLSGFSRAGSRESHLYDCAPSFLDRVPAAACLFYWLDSTQSSQSHTRPAQCSFGATETEGAGAGGVTYGTSSGGYEFCADSTRRRCAHSASRALSRVAHISWPHQSAHALPGVCDAESRTNCAQVSAKTEDCRRSRSSSSARAGGARSLAEVAPGARATPNRAQIVCVPAKTGPVIIAAAEYLPSRLQWYEVHVSGVHSHGGTCTLLCTAHSLQQWGSRRAQRAAESNVFLIRPITVFGSQVLSHNFFTIFCRASKDFDHRVPDAVNGITTTTTASSSRVMGFPLSYARKGQF